MTDHVIVNISGHRFCISRRALRRFPHTRLSQLFLRETGGTGSVTSKLVDNRKQKAGHEYFFDRSPAIFAGIMDLYRSGSIHIPPGACWQLVQDELEFWQVDPARICRSCQLLLAEQVNKQKELNEMQHAFGDDARRAADTMFSFTTNKSPSFEQFNSKNLSVKEQLAIFFREPSSAKTKWTQTYRIVFSIAVVFYVLSYILQSDIVFRVYNDQCLEEYGPPNLTTHGKNATVATTPATTTATTASSHGSGGGGTKFGSRNPEAEHMRMFKRFQKYFTSIPAPALLTLDITCLFLFSSDFFIRFALAPPPRLTFLRLPTTIADIVITAANCLATLLVWLPEENFNCSHSILLTYLTLEIFRVARLTRLLQFTSRYNGIRVLLLSLSSSLRELLLLLSGLLTAVVVFGLTIYVSEIGEAESNYDNFTVGFWWALVSMTTIGYGDYTPKTPGGMLVGALCAICGVLYVALQMPVIANRFNALYLYAREQERRTAKAVTISEATDDVQPVQQGTLTRY